MHTEGAKWRYDATADDQPRQQGMGKDLKPAQRKAPTQDQKKVRRQLQRKTAEMAPEDIFEEPHRSSPAKSWDMDRQVTTPHPLFQSAADDAGSAPAPSAGDGNMSSSSGSSDGGSGGSSSTAKTAEFSPQDVGDRECEACGYKGAPTLGDTGPTCRQCGSYSLRQGEFAQHRQRMSSLQHVATQLETNIASADGRVLLNAGDQIRLPSGQTTRVRNVRRHETSGDHYYVDTDMGTSVMPYSTRVQVVPNDTQQQSLPGYGDPRANSNSLPGQPQASGGAGAPKVGSTCPVCGGKSLIVSGAKAQCSRCGYQGSSQGNMSFSDQAQQVRVGSANPSPLSAVARRATEVVNHMKENPL